MAITRIRVREVSKVFGPLSDSNFEAVVARLGPLYEDMRIEVYGIGEETIPAMDQLDARYRRMYFLRRSIATLVEFAETVRLLQACPEFHLIDSQFTDEIRERWKQGAAFLGENEDVLKQLRNDFGGHFGLKAAKYAVEHISPEVVSGIEMAVDRLCLLRFSSEVVAIAMLRKAPGFGMEDQYKEVLQLAKSGWYAATECVHCVAFCYLWDKFGRG